MFQVTCNLLAIDGENDPVIASINAGKFKDIFKKIHAIEELSICPWFCEHVCVCTQQTLILKLWL